MTAACLKFAAVVRGGEVAAATSSEHANFQLWEAWGKKLLGKELGRLSGGLCETIETEKDAAQ